MAIPAFIDRHNDRHNSQQTHLSVMVQRGSASIAIHKPRLRSQPRRWWIAAGAALAAQASCADPPSPEPAASAGQPLIVRATPYRHDTDLPVIHDLGVRGFMVEPPATQLDASVIHEATFSNGRDSITPGATSAAAWYPQACGLDFPETESAPAFQPDLAAAIATAGPTLDQLSDDKLTDLANLLEFFDLPIHIDHPHPEDAFYGWQPVQARWLRSQYVPTSTTGAMTSQSYADPQLAGEIRERGARLYCAAREAQRQQAARPASASMGRQVALALSVFGHEIDLGVVEPTFRLAGPQRFTAAGAPDGAQGFAIPMLIGTSVTPVDGLGLPGFGELTHPVVLVAGDTEVATALAPATLHTGDRTTCNRFFCVTMPTYSVRSPKDYLTTTHADAALTRAAQLTVTVPDTPVFTIGAFTLFLNGSGTIKIGDGGAKTPSNDRLLAGAPTGWPLPARTGGTSVSPWSPMYRYDEEPWTPLFNADDPVSGTPAFRLPAVGGTATFGTNDPMVMRALADDDHHLTTRTSIDLTFGAHGRLGLAVGIAQLTFDGLGTLSVGGAHQTDLRDAALDLMGNGSGFPMTALTVTPTTSASVGASLTVTLRILIPLFIGTIDDTFTLVTASTGKTWGLTPWPQTNRALIATGSSFGDPTNQPWAVSHLPSATTPPDSPSFPIFDSFSQSVADCLADPRDNPDPPTSCPPAASGTTPHGNLCVFSGSLLVNQPVGNGIAGAWSGACSDVLGHVTAILPSGSFDQRACYASVLTALCAPTSSEQDWNGQHGVARIFDTANPNIDLATLADQCGRAFAPVSAGATFHRIFEFGTCDDAAHMIDPSKVVTASPAPGPSPIGAGTCH